MTLFASIKFGVPYSTLCFRSHAQSVKSMLLTSFLPFFWAIAMISRFVLSRPRNLIKAHIIQAGAGFFESTTETPSLVINLKNVVYDAQRIRSNHLGKFIQGDAISVPQNRRIVRNASAAVVTFAA